MMGGGNGIDDLQHGMACPQLPFLPYPAGVERSMRLAYLVPLMAVDDMDFIAGKEAGRVVHVRQQGFPRQGVHHLGQRGAHALAFSGGKDNGAQGHGNTAARAGFNCVRCVYASCGWPEVVLRLLRSLPGLLRILYSHPGRVTGVPPLPGP